MKNVVLFLLFAVSLSGYCQENIAFTQSIKNLYAAGSHPDIATRNEETEKAWNQIKASGIPFVKGDSAAFLFRGEATTVDWMGDFNGWGFRKTFHNKGKKIHGTNIWILRSSFPKDARLDYKILVNGHQWLLDPENPHQQWSGVGGGSPNSELRMPLWKADPIQTEVPGIAHGVIKRDILFASKILGYQITYSAYLPVGYEKAGKLPVLYVTDGYEYLLPELGNMATVLDNLIAQKKIQPIIAIFVDHREPINRSNNRRMDELNLNEKYLKFFADELIPGVEPNYPIQSDAAHRAILGTSMGGLTAAYFAFTRPDLFTMAGIQSPAFGTRPQIYAMCENLKGTTLKVSMTTGLINDASEGSTKMKEILEKNACVYQYRESNEGHSWGNWRSTIDDILIDLFGVK